MVDWVFKVLLSEGFNPVTVYFMKKKIAGIELEIKTMMEPQKDRNNSNLS